MNSYPLYELLGDDARLLGGKYKGHTLREVLIEFNDVDYLLSLLEDIRYIELKPFIARLYETHSHCRRLID